MNFQQPPQFVTIAGQRLAYHRSGQGEPLLLHGITTYSFIWRKACIRPVHAPRLGRSIQQSVEQFDLSLLHGCAQYGSECSLPIRTESGGIRAVNGISHFQQKPVFLGSQNSFEDQRV